VPTSLARPFPSRLGSSSRRPATFFRLPPVIPVLSRNWVRSITNFARSAMNSYAQLIDRPDRMRHLSERKAFNKIRTFLTIDKQPITLAHDENWTW